jgi:hypothetical protein
VVGKTAYELARAELDEMEHELSEQAGKLKELEANNDTFTEVELAIVKNSRFIFEEDGHKGVLEYYKIIDLEFSISRKRESLSEQRRIVKLLES